jgi:anti-anti-sigma factor
MTIAVSTTEGGSLVVSGELDIDGADALRTAVAAHAGEPVVVDLSAVSFIDSRGLSALLRLRHANPGLTLVNPTADARRLFELTGTTRLLLGDLAR